MLVMAERVYTKSRGVMSTEGKSPELSSWTGGTLRRYLSHMLGRYAEAERQFWVRAKTGGRKLFIRRRLLRAFVAWLAWLLLMFLFKVYLFSAREVLVVGLTCLPLWMLGAYFSGRWRWKVLDKKYPE